MGLPIWNDQTRAVVKKRLDEVPDRRFLTETEWEILVAVCHRLIPPPDRANRPVPIIPFIDERLHKNQGDGYRYEEMPPIERACNAGCEALIVTVDAQIYGNREWHRRATAGPKSLSWSSKFDALMRPRWFARGILTHGMPRFENVIDFVPKDRRGFFDSAPWIRSQMDRALSWETIARIPERWPRKLVINGLLSVEDVVRAAEIGADAVAISNHDGRQLDWAVAPLDLLPPRARRLVTESRFWWMAAFAAAPT
jgi:FMN-dependent dehydrogenase